MKSLYKITMYIIHADLSKLCTRIVHNYKHAYYKHASVHVFLCVWGGQGAGGGGGGSSDREMREGHGSNAYVILGRASAALLMAVWHNTYAATQLVQETHTYTLKKTNIWSIWLEYNLLWLDSFKQRYNSVGEKNNIYLKTQLNMIFSDHLLTIHVIKIIFKKFTFKNTGLFFSKEWKWMMTEAIKL